MTSIVLEDSIQMGGSTISRGGGGCWHATHFALAQRWCRQGLWFEPGWTDGCADAAATRRDTGADGRSNGDVSLPLLNLEEMRSFHEMKGTRSKIVRKTSSSCEI